MKTLKTVKITISKTKYFLLAFLVAFSVACSPEDGNDGPAGPAGTNGTNGEDGNANVIASDWFGPDGQTFISNGYTSYAEFDVSAPELTEDIYNNGQILVYFKPVSFVTEIWPTGHIAQLPITLSGGTTDHIFTFYSETSSIKIRYRREGPAASWSFSSSNQYRYILIPSNVAARTNVDFSKMTYQEVINQLGIIN